MLFDIDAIRAEIAEEQNPSKPAPEHPDLHTLTPPQTLRQTKSYNDVGTREEVQNKPSYLNERNISYAGYSAAAAAGAGVGAAAAWGYTEYSEEEEEEEEVELSFEPVGEYAVMGGGWDEAGWGQEFGEGVSEGEGGEGVMLSFA